MYTYSLFSAKELIFFELFSFVFLHQILKIQSEKHSGEVYYIFNCYDFLRLICKVPKLGYHRCTRISTDNT